MVCMLSSVTKSTTVGGRRSRDQVYVAAVPLRAAKGPAQLIMSSAYSLNLWDLQHFMVLIKPSSSASSPPLSQTSVFDFQPQDPGNIYVALAALSGRKIPVLPQPPKGFRKSFFPSKDLKKLLDLPVHKRRAPLLLNFIPTYKSVLPTFQRKRRRVSLLCLPLPNQ
ncbi:hypothetical protein ACSBR1_028345 [Camellia fascicularis]